MSVNKTREPDAFAFYNDLNEIDFLEKSENIDISIGQKQIKYSLIKPNLTDLNKLKIARKMLSKQIKRLETENKLIVFSTANKNSNDCDNDYDGDFTWDYPGSPYLSEDDNIY